MPTRLTVSRRRFVRTATAFGIGLPIGRIASVEASGATRHQQSNVQWPQFQYDAGNTGRHPKTTGPKGSVEPAWRFQPDGNDTSSPVITKQFILFKGASSNVYCLDRRSGTRIWKKNTGNSEPKVPAIVNNAVYVDGLGLSPQSGEQLWSGGSGICSPTVKSGVIYSMQTDGDLQAINADDGSYIWSTSLSSYTVPAVAYKTVYVNNGDTLYAAAVGDGSQRWGFSIGTEMSSPAVAAETVFVGTADNRVYALDALNGRFKWVFETEGPVWSSPAIADNTVFVGSDDSKVYALNAKNGKKQWEFSTNAAVNCSPAVADGVVYLKSQDGNVYAINAGDGTQRWKFRIAARSESQTQYANLNYSAKTGLIDVNPAVVDGTVYVSSPAGTLYALRETQ